MNVHDPFTANVVFDLADRFQKRQRFNVADRPADFGDDDITVRLFAALYICSLISFVMCGMTWTVTPLYAPSRSLLMTLWYIFPAEMLLYLFKFSSMNRS